MANCTGTFILAGTGLLDGREATTTWWLEQQFRARFPQVDLHMRPVVTEAERLVCAGASASYLLQAVRVVERLAVSERTLARRFKAALEQTPLAYLQRLRIDAARALLEAGDMTVESIAGQVGYGDTSSFTRLFRETVGLAPAAYRARFQ